MSEFFAPVHLLILVVVGVFVVLPFWVIFKKAGFPPAISILLLVPLVGTIVLYVVAFSQWKVVPTQDPIAPIQRDPPQI